MYEYRLFSVPAKPARKGKAKKPTEGPIDNRKAFFGILGAGERAEEGDGAALQLPF